MDQKLLLSILLMLSIIVMGACKQQPVDAVYYGDWVNTYTKEYNYETDSTAIIREGMWPLKKDMMPPILHLLDNSDYLKVFRTVSGRPIGKNSGKWSIRNNNDLTIQTDEYLYSGKIVLLNEKLSIEGIHYPLDKNQVVKREKAIRRKLKYRRATKADMPIIE